jgi:hypothetical protein
MGLDKRWLAEKLGPEQMGWDKELAGELLDLVKGLGPEQTDWDKELAGELLDLVKGLGPEQTDWDKELAERLQAAEVLPPVLERMGWDRVKRPGRCSQSPM